MHRNAVQNDFAAVYDKNLKNRKSHENIDALNNTK